MRSCWRPRTGWSAPFAAFCLGPHHQTGSAARNGTTCPLLTPPLLHPSPTSPVAITMPLPRGSRPHWRRRPRVRRDGRFRSIPFSIFARTARPGRGLSACSEHAQRDSLLVGRPFRRLLKSQQPQFTIHNFRLRSSSYGVTSPKRSATAGRMLNAQTRAILSIEHRAFCMGIRDKRLSSACQGRHQGVSVKVYSAFPGRKGVGLPSTQS